MDTIRGNAIDLFYNIFDSDPRLSQLPEHIKEWASIHIERGCNNANVDKAIDRNVPGYWEDQYFQEQYSTIVYKTAINIDPQSSVNQSQPESHQRYLMDQIYNSAIIKYLFDISLDNELYTDQPNLKLSEKSRCGFNGLSSDIFIRINDNRIIPCVDLIDLGYMNSDVLNPHINAPYKQQIKLREQQQVEVKTTHMYPCPQCKTADAKYRRLQTRSGDEGYTIFLTCQYCGFCWRIYG